MSRRGKRNAESARADGATGAEAWRDVFWGDREAAVATQSGRRSPRWMEQGELCFDPPQLAAAPTADEPDRFERVAVQREPVEHDEMIQVSQLSLAEQRVKVTRARRPVARAESRPQPAVSRTGGNGGTMPPRQIARFLNANGVVDGMRSDGVRMALPGPGLTSKLNLWRGSPSVGDVL